MKRSLLLLTLCVVTFPVIASHIVGGEFEIRYISSNRYEVRLILYFDLQNGNPGAQDDFANARIFRKRDNRFMQDVFLPLDSISRVSYTQPECSNGEIQTNKLIYKTTVTFSDSQYGDAQGYYIVWERCCRNYNSKGLLNIVSAEPPPGVIDYPTAAGQTFYLEFPPVVKDGKPFINSTPRLFPPLNDYACPNKFYYADFAGTDVDGDSLAYSLVTPLNTHTAEAIPSAGPASAPYPLVTWRSPFNLTNIVGGAPDLKVTSDGLLTVTPTLQGLFVFAVKCEEYRKGVKLGEVRRDFQMLVVDACPVADPPQILGKKLTDGSFTYDETMNVTFSNTVSDANRCIEVQVSDTDALKSSDGFMENVTIKAIPLGFKKDVSGILPSITSVTLTSANPTKTFQICFDECPYIEGPFTIGIVAFDDACSLPYFDTLKVLVNITPPVNHNPYYVTSNITSSITEGSALRKWLIKAVDEDFDVMTQVIVPGIGIDLASAGMSFKSLGQVGDTLFTEFTWDPRCDVYNFTSRTNFDIMLQVEDKDDCNFNHPDQMKINLNILLPGNSKPIIFSPELTNNSPLIDTVNLERKVNESLTFHVNGRDVDKDKLILTGTGKDFSLATYSITFPGDANVENVSSLFAWNITCDNVNLDEKDEFTFHFIVSDNENKCRFRYSDTLVVNVTVTPPDNTAPELFISSVNPELLLSTDNHLAVTLGQQIDLSLNGFDYDTSPHADLLQLKLLSATGNVQPEGYTFAGAEGLGNVQSPFTWKPECDIFTNGVYENDYVFTFLVSDNRCFNEKGDTIDVNIKIKDIDGSDTEFLPPNVITPNGDLKNDFFAMIKRDAVTGELKNILPLDNCTGHFEGIVIYNRWGREIFTSADREFKWYAPGEASGIYYYLIKYSNKEYKGVVSVSYWDDESQAQR
jgi:hypothetical protein